MRYNPDTERGNSLTAVAAQCREAAAAGASRLPAGRRIVARVTWRSPYTGELRQQFCTKLEEALSLVSFYQNDAISAKAEIVSFYRP
jgi:hypothetical protein